MRRVVVTGFGIVSSIGNNIEEVLDSLLNTKSGIVFSEEYKGYGFRSQVCGSIKLDLDEALERKEKRFMGDGSAYAYIAMKEAIKNKRITEIFQPNYDKIIVFGFGFTETSHYLIMEFFSNGNLILTDNEYNIITLIRIHDYDDTNKVRVRNKYIFPECNKEIPEYINYKFIYTNSH